MMQWHPDLEMGQPKRKKSPSRVLQCPGCDPAPFPKALEQCLSLPAHTQVPCWKIILQQAYQAAGWSSFSSTHRRAATYFNIVLEQIPFVHTRSILRNAHLLHLLLLLLLILTVNVSAFTTSSNPQRTRYPKRARRNPPPTFLSFCKLLQDGSLRIQAPQRPLWQEGHECVQSFSSSPPFPHPFSSLFASSVFRVGKSVGSNKLLNQEEAMEWLQGCVWWSATQGPTQVVGKDGMVKGFSIP